ncbi:hypothetical protein E4U41_001133 [Claviceps citrina]|nr:hypothetical protein E4U41_001133 [Claviceps citrina]
MRPIRGLTSSLLAFLLPPLIHSHTLDPTLGHADTDADAGHAAATAPPPSFDWSSIPPSRTLVYHPCFDNTTTHCARLVLPLDYLSHDHDANDTRTVVLAIVKRPAVVPDSHPSFGGSIFINPGGPGGSATDTVRRLGPYFQQSLERSGRRHYEYIGIDPRGVGFSSPPANCFPGDLFSRQTLAAEKRGLGPLEEGDSTLPRGLALAEGFARRCLEADRAGANGGPVMAYAGTASVARDMVEVADQIARLRREQADQARQRTAANSSSSAASATDNSTRHDVARVQYIGFSYGTVLGHYLVSLFPERVGRIVLDGVVDAHDYSTGAGWTNNLIDTDKIYTHFLTGCHQNPSTCALARQQDTSARDIQHRLEAWLRALHKNPLTSLGPTGDVRVLSDHDVRAYMGSSFYQPLATYRDMARRLDAAMTGNASDLFDTYFQTLTPNHSPDGCLVDDQALGPNGGDGTFPVLCGDGDDVSHKDAAWWRRYSRQLVSQSFILGPHWATIRFHCSRWPFSANWRFTGPFTAPAPRRDAHGSPVPGFPAAPNLYLSSRLDPVTPLVNAFNMKRGYPASGLVIVDGAGHTAVNAASENKCLFAAVEDYLETGLVPRDTTVCQLECGPWQLRCPGQLALAKRHDWHPFLRRLPTFPLAAAWS